MPVPRPNIRWRGAHPSNFTVGRQGVSRDGRETFHHVVGSRESAVIVFNNPSRGASSHFVVGGDIIDQCVDINNTAWTDGNWESNLRSITVEHEGGWNGTGPYSDAMYEQAAHLCAWLREQYGVNRAIRHRDVTLKSTACPGGLDVERIWNRATQIINQYKQPPAQPEWLRNRKEVPLRTVYAQRDGVFIHNMNNPGEPADSRRFALNQSFEIKGETKVGPHTFLITTSSFNANIPNGLIGSDVFDKPYVPPVPQPIPQPPQPDTPDWADALLKDEENREMYVLRATPIIDLEHGRPFQKDGKEVWLQAGDIVKDVSAHTIVAGVTYQLTEYSFKEIQGKRYQNANGIKASDLTIDPKACPPGTPANPTVPEPPEPEPTDPGVEPLPDVPPVEPEYPGWFVSFWQKLIDAILGILGRK